MIKDSVMTMKLLVLIAVLVSGFFTACARSNNSDSATSSVRASDAKIVAKLESASFTTENGRCGLDENALMKTEAKADSVHLYMNEDGSAVFKERMWTICRWDGKITNISLEKLKDTLLVSIEFYEYPRGTVIHLPDSTVYVVGHERFKCGGCSYDYEIDVPATLAGAKYVNIITPGAKRADLNIKAKVLRYPIAYVKE